MLSHSVIIVVFVVDFAITICKTQTFAPGNLFVVSKLMAVREVVKVAVNIEMMQIPRRIQRTAKTRPGKDWGALSPYLKENKI